MLSAGEDGALRVSDIFLQNHERDNICQLNVVPLTSHLYNSLTLSMTLRLLMYHLIIGVFYCTPIQVFHVIRDSLSTDMSQKILTKHGNSLDSNNKFDGLQPRLSPLVSLASVDTRGRDWPDILTCHKKDSNVYVSLGLYYCDFNFESTVVEFKMNECIYHQAFAYLKVRCVNKYLPSQGICGTLEDEQPVCKYVR